MCAEKSLIILLDSQKKNFFRGTLCIVLYRNGTFLKKNFNFWTERWEMSDAKSLFFCVFPLGHKGMPFIFNMTSAHTKKDTFWKLRPSIATQLASAVWRFIQGSEMQRICGINKPEAGKINMKDGPLLLAFSDHKHLIARCPYSYRHSNDAPSTSQSVTLFIHHLSLSVSRLLTSSYFFFPSFFSGLSPKADGPCEQMLPTQSLKREKQKAGSKTNKICWRVPRRRAGKFVVQLILDLITGWLFYQQVERKHTGGRKNKSTNDKDFFLGPVFMLRSTINFAAVGTSLRPSDEPNLTV